MPDYPRRSPHPYGSEPENDPPFHSRDQRFAEQPGQARTPQGQERRYRRESERGRDREQQLDRQQEAAWNRAEPPDRIAEEPQWGGRSRLRSGQQGGGVPDRPEPAPVPRSRYRALGPLTAASGAIKRIVTSRPAEPQEQTNPIGLHYPDRKELNPPSRRSSFFDMESEAHDVGWAAGDQNPAPRNPASFPSLGGSRTGPPQPPPSFRRPRRRGGRFPLIAGLLAVLLAIGGVAYALRGGDDENPAPPTATTPPATATAEPSETKKPQVTTGAAKKVKFGVYKGTFPAQVSAFGEEVGRRPTFAMDYSTRANWDQIADPSYMLNTWRNTDYQMVYAVAMLPTRDKTVSLAAGADGDYDKHFERLARNLVAAGQGDAILRLGWEFNVDWPWHPSYQQAKDFIQYWRSIVKAMRSVPGADGLKFDWNVNNGGETYDSSVFYPGNKYVDYIGVDVYDISWAQDTYPYPASCDADCRRAHQERAFQEVMDAKFGLAFWSSFAQAKNKPLSLPEWGLWNRSRSDGHGGADNPYFIEQMFKFIDDPRNNVAYQIYFDVNVEEKGDHRLESMPKSEKRFKKLFG